MIVLPGGQPGADNLNNDDRIHLLVTQFQQAGKYIAAICAAPIVLADAGVLSGRHATSYPGALDPQKWSDISISNDAIVMDDFILTSKGPGTAMDFALLIIELLTDKTTRDEVEAGLVRS